MFVYYRTLLYSVYPYELYCYFVLLPLLLDKFHICKDPWKVNKDEDEDEHKITLVMQQLELWFCNNDLIVNIDKTCGISFHSHQNTYPSRPYIIFNNNEIEYS